MLAVGDETGLLKLVDASNPVVKSYGTQSRAETIVGMAPIDRTNFSVLRVNGRLERWRVEKSDDATELSIAGSVESGLPSTVKGVCAVYDAVKYQASASFVYTEGGDACILPSSSVGPLVPTQFKVTSPISSAVSCRGGGVAFGGKENDLSILDTSTQTVVWKAKNVPDDKLRLRVPIWVASIAIFNSEESEFSNCTLLSGTAYKQVRVYDTRTGKRPVNSFDIGEYRVSQIVAPSDLRTVIVSNSIGDVHQFDLRTGRKLHALKASDGTIRSMQMYDNEDLLACVGLDRHVRWHNPLRTSHVRSIYLYNRLNCCLPLSRGADGAVGEELGQSQRKRKRSDSSGDEDDDEGDEDVDMFLDGEEPNTTD